MPPKRKGAKAPAKGGKKSKVAEEEPSTSAGDTVKDAISKLKAADQGKAKGSAKLDAKCPLAATSARVYLDYDCMLNQTNIGNNNNKYYIIQALQQGFTFYLWTRWGRVGEDGMNALKPCDNADAAVAEFKKKFKDKTKNDWDSRASFVPKAGKYTLLEMDATEESSTDTADKMAKLDEIDGVKSMVASSKLDKVTQDLIKLIFDNDMFKSAMADLEIDVKKMPLGKISKTQIAKGFEVLEKIEDDLAAKKINRKNLEEHCSQFYTLVPHNFGRQRPSLIEDEETLKKKYDMLTVLGDIEIALSIQKEKDKRSMEMGTKELPNPLDINYELLQTDLEHVDKKSKEFKVLEKYTTETSGSWRKPTIVDVWKVSRHGEDKRFAAHDKLGNRKLLWHGTNVAVVAAIMKGGLRIMPHSGGRVGKGIYFASENSKSAGYVRCVGNTGIMFLNEVVLGKEHHITRDDWTLDKAPAGYDCIIAKGHTEPDPKKDTSLQIDGKGVTVPQAKPIKVNAFSHSSFSQSEYLIYKESQNRIRYMLKMQF